MNTTYDPINHPLHYNWHPSGIECATIAEGFSYNLGNAIKYIWRCDHKGHAVEDLQKAVAYLNREINRRINEANSAPLVTKSVSLPTPLIQCDGHLRGDARCTGVIQGVKISDSSRIFGYYNFCHDAIVKNQKDGYIVEPTLTPTQPQ